VRLVGFCQDAIRQHQTNFTVGEPGDGGLLSRFGAWRDSHQDWRRDHEIGGDLNAAPESVVQVRPLGRIILQNK
jgi:hypothetical protein